MKNIFINVSFLLFILLVLYPDIERIFYFNEFFAFIGFCLLIKNGANYLKQRYIVLRCVLFYNLYCFIYAIISFIFLQSGNNYEFIRTLPIWYSSLAFFVGIEFVQQINFRKWFGSLRGNILLILLSFAIPGRLTQQLILPFTMINHNLRKYFIVITCAYFIYKGGATSYVSIVTLLLLTVFNNSIFNNIIKSKLFVPSLVVVFSFSLWWFKIGFEGFFIDNDYGRFEGITEDKNIIWRLMFWVYQFENNIRNFPFFGIGFGTPLFDLKYVPDFLTSDDGSRATPYTLGTHNSLVFILIRLGLTGLLPILIIYSKLLRDYFNMKNYPIQIILFFLFVFISLSMLFNVILESPLYGGIYWIVTGMFYQSLKFKKDSFNRRSLSNASSSFKKADNHIYNAK